ncbi:MULTISPECIES: hypothetical protein [unclassified Streptomyces]|uniref:hypothetical protein n=1 Tax=unclassified Streptomyces TaxID=2593676 RepID=UPI000B863B8B|nr:MULTISPECIES: hypothetical protein [unclassified Streptomyces]MYS19471.1 hypothetical protein [Streptomyces sp. SID4948]
MAAAVSIVLATTAAGALPAAGAAPRTAGPPGQPYELNLTTDRATTDYDHRTVDLSGILTHADGTPVVDGSVDVTEAIVFTTWNPWGDPIDPWYYDARSLGTVHTDQNGRFDLPDTLVDHVGDSSLAQSYHEVEFDAQYDPDGNPDTYTDLIYESIRRPATPVPSTITATVDKTRVRPGDTLNVTGTVAFPAGHGSVDGTPVFLRAFSESESDAQTTADAAGHFSFHWKVRGDDDDFAVYSAPKDFYIGGDFAALPVATPITLSYSAVSATVDANGLATAKATVNPSCAGSGAAKQTFSLQFAAEGSTSWRTVATAAPAAGGALKGSYKGGNGSYRWVHAETDVCTAATSAAKAVHRTKTHIAGFHGTPQPVRRGQRLRLNGTLQYLDGSTWKPRGKHPVEIWYRPTSTSTWTRKYVVQSSDRGAFQKTFNDSTRGWWRTIVVGTTGLYTSISDPDWIEVL